jgi:radical SAM superfamily enzyme YgiQ (UPF0313 family)
MRYEGPIYRPPSEADSLLIQATVGCPHNKCAFCMVYKQGPRYRVRAVEEIREDIRRAREEIGDRFRSLFLPAGNTIAMPTKDLAAVCRYAREQLSSIERITVYGSSQYILEKGLEDLEQLRAAGLSRIHVGLESGDDEILRRVKKGVTAEGHVRAGRLVMEAGIELSEYVVLGLGGVERTEAHAEATAEVLNRVSPHFIRLRTLVPKVNTLLLHQIRKGRFQLLRPHGVLRETRRLLQGLDCSSSLASDHYTNYVDLKGQLPQDRERLLRVLERALRVNEACYRPQFVGTA